MEQLVCDRCKEIIKPKMIFAFRKGIAVNAQHFDLCEICSVVFEKWLKSMN